MNGSWCPCDGLQKQKWSKWVISVSVRAAGTAAGWLVCSAASVQRPLCVPNTCRSQRHECLHQVRGQTALEGGDWQGQSKPLVFLSQQRFYNVTCQNAAASFCFFTSINFKSIWELVKYPKQRRPWWDFSWIKELDFLDIICSLLLI